MYVRFDCLRKSKLFIVAIRIHYRLQLVFTAKAAPWLLGSSRLGFLKSALPTWQRPIRGTAAERSAKMFVLLANELALPCDFHCLTSQDWAGTQSLQNGFLFTLNRLS